MRPLIERARLHAATHPESRDLIDELILVDDLSIGAVRVRV